MFPILVGRLVANLPLQYFLDLKIGFPGIGNNLKGRVPIVVISSMLPPGAGAWDGPPRELDLPPYVIQILLSLGPQHSQWLFSAYFSASNWNRDEKDTD